MSLKTATLIALIGVTAHLCLSIPAAFYMGQLYRISIHLGQLFSMFLALLGGGSFVLFLAVFYGNLKE